MGPAPQRTQKREKEWQGAPSRHRKRWIYAVLLLFVLIAAPVFWYQSLFPELPQPVQIGKISWLEQGWTADQREKYFQTPQGSLIIPYSWFLALEQPGAGNHELFSNERNLVRYDVIPDDSRFNPDHLPVGIGKQVLPAEYVQDLGCGAPPCAAGVSVHREWLTYTCAACHTSVLRWHGKSIGINGGRGRWNFTVFNTTLANLLLLTRFSPGMFDRFSARVLRLEGRPDTSDERSKLKGELTDFLLGPAIVDGVVGGIKRTYPTEEGYGRMDALGRGSNGQFGSLDKRNILVANAPVLIPPLWYTHDYDWVQTVAAIRQPLGRNVTESWGVNSAVDLTNPNDEMRFSSSIGIRDMFWMETLISTLKEPVWPEDLFGKVDPEAVKLGKYLYEEKVFDRALTPAQEQWCPEAAGPDGWQPCPNPNLPSKGLCARCHGAVAEVNANPSGKHYWQLPMYKLDVIGTDPLDAVNFNGREVYTGALRGLFGGKEKVGIGEALFTTTSGIMAREFSHQKIAQPEQALVSGYRSNGFRAPLAYPARPLPGYWATPPYLHNGAVPNLYELLSPVSERSATFWTGDLEFDPVKVGYRSEKFDGGFEFNTRRSLLGGFGYSFRQLLAGRLEFKRAVDGNSNLGHEFRDAPRGTKGVIGPYLSPKERQAILEYMKVMQELKPPDPTEELRRKELLKNMEREYEGSGLAYNRPH